MRWKLAILIVAVGGGVGLSIALRKPATSNSDSDSPDTVIFSEVVGAGFEFSHAAESDDYFMPKIMGAGGAFLDFDNDGDLDIFLVNSGLKHRDGTPSSNRLFEQTEGGQFRDITEQAGLLDEAFGLGVAVGDLNNDGWPDLFVTNYGADTLYLNQGNRTFRDVTVESGIDSIRWGSSACFADYDRDGWLDLYITNYVDFDRAKTCRDSLGKEEFCGPQALPPVSDRLYRNVSSLSDDGDVRPIRFEDVSVTSGIGQTPGPGLGVVASDFNGDGWTDFYVANDQASNFLWINKQDGTFEEQAILHGSAYDGQGRAQSSMGIALGDLDGDSKLDLYLTHLDGESNTLYLRQGDSAFRESSGASGLLSPSFSYTGFGTATVDIEHDGDLDLLVVNGRVTRSPDAETVVADDDHVAFWHPYMQRNQLLLNDGSAEFSELLSDDDPFLAVEEISRGLIVGDVDNDGDQDILVTNLAGPARLYRNESTKKGAWLQVRVVDPKLGGRDAYGSVITVHAGGRSWRQVANPGYSYLASNDPRVHFGLGAVETYEAIDVVWPDGTNETFAGGPVDQLIRLEHGQGAINE